MIGEPVKPIGPYGEKWAKRFKVYDALNPHVWDLFKLYTFKMINHGHDKHLSAILVLYRIRYEAMITTKGDAFKINCAYGPSYARKFMEAYPKYEGLFETRTRVVLGDNGVDLDMHHEGGF